MVTVNGCFENTNGSKHRIAASLLTTGMVKGAGLQSAASLASAHRPQ